MLQSQQTLQITDYGAGSRVNTSPTRQVRDIAQHSKKSARLARLFYRLIQRFEYSSVFDLGTSLGLTTLYMAQANPHAHITTFEGCPETAKVAQQNFRQWASAVSYTHLRAHETRGNLVCRLLLEKNFFNDTATTEIYTRKIVGSVRCV